jgi:hypothetical protein
MGGEKQRTTSLDKKYAFALFCPNWHESSVLLTAMSEAPNNAATKSLAQLMHVMQSTYLILPKFDPPMKTGVPPLLGPSSRESVCT